MIVDSVVFEKGVKPAVGIPEISILSVPRMRMAGVSRRSKLLTTVGWTGWIGACRCLTGWRSTVESASRRQCRPGVMVLAKIEHDASVALIS